MFDRKEWTRVYYQTHKEEYATRRKKWAEENKDKINAYNQKYRDNDRQRYRAYNRKADEKRKILALTAYSPLGVPICARCGITNIDVLCVDHISNNGKECREKHGSGVTFYQWLKTNNFPPGFQVLCWNCNHLKELERIRNG